jgi:starch synthase
MANGTPPKVLLAASEVVGFAKTGGLADVVGSLPRALARRGIACAVILPLYRSARRSAVPQSPTGRYFTVPVGERQILGSLWRATLPDSDIPVYFIEQPEYFERDDPSAGRGLYQFALPDGRLQDYPDNCARFVFFCRAVLEALPLLDEWPDILHLNDWQTGLVPVYLRELYNRRPCYGGLSTLFTMHNVAYQGRFWALDMPLTGLDGRLFNPRQLEFYGFLSFLKAGVVFADLISTVSSTYAREIQTPYFGCGMEGVFAERRDRLVGIVNGVDYAVWDPVRDPFLAAAYEVNSVAQRKPRCKAALQNRYGLPEEPRAPLLAMIARLAEQKGVELVVRAADSLFRRGVQLVMLGEGDPGYQRQLLDLRSRYPGQHGCVFAFDDGLAHQIEAGADLFLMPSLYEPSGLTQLYSLRYGTVPIVRATGGLADTITDYTPETAAAGTATGFSFKAYSPQALLEAVDRALALYQGDPQGWLRLMQTGMRQDWSWDRSAAEYERLYIRLRDDKARQEGRGPNALALRAMSPVQS